MELETCTPQISTSVIQIFSASSARTDKSFEMCHFVDDPPPLRNRFRSEEFKVLLREYIL